MPNPNSSRKPQEYDDIDAISQETPFNVSDLEDSDFENEDFEYGEQMSNERNLGKVFENKIKDLEMRCMNGLGEEIYKQGYELLQANRGMKPEEMRPYITGKDSICESCGC